jgi:hypothetical protein
MRQAHRSGCGILHDAGQDAHRVLEPGPRVLPAGLRVGEKLLRRGRAGIGLRIGLGEGLIDRADAVGDPLRLGQELLGLGDGLFEGVERGIGQARKIARLVDQHGGLVLEALDFVVDLLQLTRCSQHALRIVGGIEDDPLCVRRRTRCDEREYGDACRKCDMQVSNRLQAPPPFAANADPLCGGRSEGRRAPTIRMRMRCGCRAVGRA